MNTVVVGLDGAGFQLLQPWLDEGELPTLASLIENGCSGPLQSSLPPVTCPAWRCYSTGVNPGKHGVFWWEQVDRKGRDFRIPTAKSFDATDLWHHLGDAGYRSAVINMPTTYPPEPIDGQLISGGSGAEGGQYTYPDGLQAKIESRFDYKMFLEEPTTAIGSDPSLVDDALELIDTRFAVAEYLREEHGPDFLHLTVFYTNVFHHFFWDSEVTKRVWQRVDENLASLLEPDDNVLLMSDHGTNRIDYTFNINTWLDQQGHLVTTKTVSDTLGGVNLTRDWLATISATLGLKNTLKRLLPRRYIDMLPRSDGSVAGSGKANKIDWAASTAMASGQGPVYVLENNDARRKEIREVLRDELLTLETPDGRPVVTDVHRAEDVYSGPYVDDGPDLVLEQADNVYVSGALGLEDPFESPNDWVAENHRDGIFVAHGPDVRSGEELQCLPQIYDVAPTILHWYGQAVPERMDGRVLTELFRTDSEPAERRVMRESHDDDGPSAVSGEDNQEQMRERLKDLGYLSE